MATAAVAPQTETPALPLEPIRVFIPCDRCDTLEIPGLTHLTPWGLLCLLCHDAGKNAANRHEQGPTPIRMGQCNVAGLIHVLLRPEMGIHIE